MLKAIRIVGDRELIEALRGVARDDVPFVTAYALTKTGQDVKAAEYSEMQRVFDRPTRYALNSLQLKTATKQDLTAVVDYKLFGGVPAERYLGPNVEGGARRHKSHERALISAGVMRSDEFAVPGKGAVLDTYGNMKGGHLSRILSQVRASRDPTQNMTAKSRKRSIKSAGGQYFVLRDSSAAPGIYQRSGSRGPIVPVLLFVRAPKYQRRFDFYGVGQRIFSQNIASHVRAGWSRAMASRRKAAA
jgi:hypothetical protein